MQANVQTAYEWDVDRSHHGRPEIIQQVHTGGRGRPSIWIDPHFLQWAYTLCSTSSIAQFLNVNRHTVHNALFSYGIATPQPSKFTHLSLAKNVYLEKHEPGDNNGGPGHDNILDPLASSLNSESTSTTHQITSYTGPLSDISDSDLDCSIQTLHHQFTRAGVAMIDGMLRNLGYCIPRERIRHLLIRINPIHWVFERIQIQWWVYSVPGPNSLWHHDGQHGKNFYLFYIQTI